MLTQVISYLISRFVSSSQSIVNFVILNIQSTAAPGMFDIKGKAKWNAWSGKKGMTTDEAMQKYINKFQALSA